jgi:hypothetical protein
VEVVEARMAARTLLNGAKKRRHSEDKTRRANSRTQRKMLTEKRGRRHASCVMVNQRLTVNEHCNAWHPN